jgi:TonB family protein
MTAANPGIPIAFKRALVFSACLHAALLIVIAASPSFSRTAPKGLVQYVNFIGSPGSGGPGGGGGGAASVAAKPQPPPPAKKPESLRDLTVAQKVAPPDKGGMRYPVEKPKTTKKAPEKKTVISKPQPKAAAEAAAEAPPAASGQGQGQEGGQGTGYGLRFGIGSGAGTGGAGGGSGSGESFGVSGFPYTYYLQFLSEKISSSWFTSLVDPGISGQFQTQVYFKIYRNGQIADLKVETSSGIPSFDLSALRAIQSAAPFPPLPSDYDGQYLGIHLIFEHSR